jgi:hypothetical protein
VLGQLMRTALPEDEQELRAHAGTVRGLPGCMRRLSGRNRDVLPDDARQ